MQELQVLPATNIFHLIGDFMKDRQGRWWLLQVNDVERMMPTQYSQLRLKPAAAKTSPAPTAAQLEKTLPLVGTLCEFCGCRFGSRAHVPCPPGVLQLLAKETKGLHEAGGTLGELAPSTHGASGSKQHHGLKSSVYLDPADVAHLPPTVAWLRALVKADVPIEERAWVGGIPTSSGRMFGAGYSVHTSVHSVGPLAPLLQQYEAAISEEVLEQHAKEEQQVPAMGYRLTRHMMRNAVTTSQVSGLGWHDDQEHSMTNPCCCSIARSDK